MTDEDLQSLKRRCHADDSTLDDQHLRDCLVAAEAATLRYCNTTAEREMVDGAYPADLRTGILMLAADLYENSGSVSSGSVTPTPYTYDFLIKPFRR